MGRAIDMENDIQKLEGRVNKLEDIVRGMTHSMDEISGKSSKTKHVDLVDDVKSKESDNVKEKNDDEGSRKSNKSSNKSSRTSKTQNK